jgi:hypothetical protein
MQSDAGRDRRGDGDDALDSVGGPNEEAVLAEACPEAEGFRSLARKDSQLKGEFAALSEGAARAAAYRRQFDAGVVHLLEVIRSANATCLVPIAACTGAPPEVKPSRCSDTFTSASSM